MERFNVLNARKLADTENIHIFLTGGQIQRYLSGTLFSQHTLQTQAREENLRIT